MLTNWHFSRLLRLGMGLWLLVWALQARDWSIGLFSGMFLFMAVSNIGCCGAQGCAVPETDRTNNKNN